MKGDGSTLFENLTEAEQARYEYAYERLLVLRREHREYRDDQLLMLLLCTEFEMQVREPAVSSEQEQNRI